jgi:hypothetical protein
MRKPQRENSYARTTSSKAALATAEAKLSADPGEVAKLERQLKAAKTRIRNLDATNRIVSERARANPVSISKRDYRKLQHCLHPDSGRARQKTEASQCCHASDSAHLFGE